MGKMSSKTANSTKIADNTKTMSGTKSISSSKTSHPKTENTSTKADSHHFKAYVRQGAREGALILLIAMCVFLFMALLTHHPDDPGFVTTGNHTLVKNYGGNRFCADIIRRNRFIVSLCGCRAR